MFDLLIITGASRGIGANIFRFCRPKVKKCICISSSGKIKDFVGDPNVQSLAVDLANFEELGDKLRKAIGFAKPFKSVAVVLCGASLGAAGGLRDADFYSWDRLFRINVLGNLAVFREAIDASTPETLIRGVFFAGGGAAYGYPDFSAYALTKVSIVRAVENLSLELNGRFNDSSVIALAPGAVATEMLEEVIKHGGVVKTRTDIREPTIFVSNFLNNKKLASSINGCFVHVRDNLLECQERLLDSSSHFKLRRIE